MAYQGAPYVPNPRDLFAQVDLDRSGRITVDELQRALSGGGWKPFDMKTCVLLMSMFDRDRSGSIDIGEFEGLWNYLGQWRQCFDSFDRDRSGSMDVRREFPEALSRMGYRLSPPTVNAMIMAYDKDRSGSLGFDEFIQCFCELQIITGEFAKLDTNRNGVIQVSYDQFVQMIFRCKS